MCQDKWLHDTHSDSTAAGGGGRRPFQPEPFSLSSSHPALWHLLQRDSIRFAGMAIKGSPNGSFPISEMESVIKRNGATGHTPGDGRRAGKREGVLGVAIWCEEAKWRLQLHLFSPGVCREGSKAGVKWTLLTPPWLRITNKIRDLQRRPPALWGSLAKAASYRLLSLFTWRSALISI